MAINFKKTTQQGLNAIKGFNFGGNGGAAYSYQDPWGSYFRPVSGAQFDYRREVGIAWENSAIMACVNYVSRTFPEAPLVLQVKDKTHIDGWTTITDSPVLELLKAPNRDNPQSYLWSGALLSYMIDGNIFWFVEKNRLDQPIGLYYIPHFQIVPRWPENGSVFISDYLRRVGTKAVIYKPDEIIQICQGVDPNNTRRGMSPIAAVLREICTDNEASTAAAAIMRNLGIPGLTFTPADGEDMTNEQMQKMREISRMKMTGDRRGELLTMPIPGKFDQFGFSPEQLAFDKIRRVPEERISAQFGIPAVVAGLGAGLERSTYSNMREAREAAYESCLIPMWRTISEQLSNKLLPMFDLDPNTHRLHFDISQIQALQEDNNSKHERIRLDWEKGVIKRNEARVQLGFNYELNDPQWKLDDVYVEQLPKILDENRVEDVEEDVKSLNGTVKSLSTDTKSLLTEIEEVKGKFRDWFTYKPMNSEPGAVTVGRNITRGIGIPVLPTDDFCSVCNKVQPTEKLVWHYDQPASQSIDPSPRMTSYISGQPWTQHIPERAPDMPDFPHKPVCTSCFSHLNRLYDENEPSKLIHVSNRNTGHHYDWDYNDELTEL